MIFQTNALNTRSYLKVKDCFKNSILIHKQQRTDNYCKTYFIQIFAQLYISSVKNRLETNILSASVENIFKLSNPFSENNTLQILNLIVTFLFLIYIYFFDYFSAGGLQ